MPVLWQRFNFLAVILTNAAQMGIMTHDALTCGASLLERDKWTDVIAKTRQVGRHTGAT